MCIRDSGNNWLDWEKVATGSELDTAISQTDARITREAKALAEEDKALTQRLDTFTSGFGDKNLSTIINDVKTYADTDKASASSLNTLTAEFNNLEIGGRNLIRNSHNPSDLSEWSGTASNLGIVTHGWFYNKAKTLFRLLNTSTSEVTASTARFFVERNTDYTLSFTGFADSRVSCLLYTSPSPRDRTRSRMPSSA